MFQKLLVKESNGHMNLMSVILAWDNNLRPNEFTTKQKLDGVGPVDNRPSTDKLQQFVKKNKKK